VRYTIECVSASLVYLNAPLDKHMFPYHCHL
jgi:hypothetical protein